METRISGLIQSKNSLQDELADAQDQINELQLSATQNPLVGPFSGAFLMFISLQMTLKNYNFSETNSRNTAKKQNEPYKN
jgi:hypothetical protein